MLSRLGARLAGLCGLMLMIGVSACRKDPLEVIKDRKSTRLNSSHSQISYAVFCLKKKNAYLDETAYCYVATGLTPDPLPSDDDEFFERTIVPWSDALRMALDGQLTASFSKVAIIQHALAGR